MTAFITAHRERFGVEPICTALQIAPSTYYAAVSRHPSARAVRDAELKAEISRVHGSNFGVYGVRKVWRQMLREEVPVGRDRVARLMAALGLAGATRGTTKRTTIPAQVEQRPGDLVERQFTAPAPNRLWVADLTYVATWSGFCYVAFDNALAESLNGLFKTELIRRGGSWRTVEDVELATLAWVDWYNHRRLHSACDNLPPSEFETRYYQQHRAVGAA